MSWAFSNESERGNLMLFGLMTASTAEVIRARRELRALLMPGQRRVHTAKESPRRRRQLLDVVGGLDVATVVFRLRRSAGMHRIDSRALTLGVGVCGVETKLGHQLGARRPGASASRPDRRTIDRAIGADADLSYDHRPSHDEPMLWAVDAIVWAVGAGGPMFDRIRPGVELVDLRP